MKSVQFLSQRRFLPFFLVQFLTAFNDNVFKNALVLLLAFSATSEAESGMQSSAAAGLLMLPFFLFSPLAGQLADRFDKARYMTLIKGLEVFIMVLGAIAYSLGSAKFLYAVLFLVGTHSAFFGPAKFSILPQVFREEELVAANAMVELGTFLAILLGTVLGGLCSEFGAYSVATAICSIAILGWIASLYVPRGLISNPHLKIQWNPAKEVRSLSELVLSNKRVFLAILGISWFWFMGTSVLSQLPIYTKFFLGADKTVVTILLATFCLSIGIGSFFCELMSGEDIEIGLVPLGAAGISLFCLDIAMWKPITAATPITANEFLFSPLYRENLRSMIDIFGMGLFGSIFIIPLNAMVQHLSDPKHCSRVIAANNMLNAILMVAASLLVTLMYSMGLNTQQIFLILAFINAIATVSIFFIIPDFAMRFVVWVLASTIYRLRYTDKHNIPKAGPAIIAANHVSYIDFFIIAATSRRPVRFVMWYKFFHAPFFNSICRLAKAIPIATSKEDPEIKKKAFEQIDEELRKGNVICIFPEGTITTDGKPLSFKYGIEEIQKLNPAVPIVPLALKGLWGSYFSRSGGRAFLKVPKPRWRRIQVVVGNPIAEFISAEDLRVQVENLIGDADQD